MSGYFDVFDLTAWLRNSLAVFPQALDMEFDGFTNLAFHFFKCCASCHAAGEIWHVS